MPNTESGKIRNVAVIGHRGTGKTSLVEALLYESGTTNRLGSVAEKLDRLRLRRRGAPPRHVDLGHRHPPGVAGPQHQPDRHAGRAELPGRRALGAARGRGRDRHRLGRAGRRGRHRAAVAALRRAGPLPPAAREPARSRAGRLLRDPRGPPDPALAAVRGRRDPDRAGARVPRGGRPGAHGRLPARRRRGPRRAGRHPGRHARGGRRVPRQADGHRRRDVRRADGALSRGRRDQPRGDGPGAQEPRHRGRALPGRLRRGHPQHRLARPARPDRRGPAVARPGAQRARGGRRLDAGVRLQDDRRPVQRQDQPAARLRRHADVRLDPGQQPHPRQGAHRPAAGAAGQGAHARPTRFRAAPSAPSPSSRRPAPATSSPTSTAPRRSSRWRSRPRSCRSRSSPSTRARRRRCTRRCGGCRRRIPRSTSTATRRRARRSSPASRRCTWR